jgi:hypothetical protein
MREHCAGELYAMRSAQTLLSKATSPPFEMGKLPVEATLLRGC